MVSRIEKDERTHPSSHTNYSYLSTPEKDERLNRLHAESKMAKLRIARLEKKITELINDDGICVEEDLYDDMKQIISDATEQIYSSYQPNTFQHLFWKQQLKAGSAIKSWVFERCPLYEVASTFH